MIYGISLESLCTLSILALIFLAILYGLWASKRNARRMLAALAEMKTQEEDKDDGMNIPPAVLKLPPGADPAEEILSFLEYISRLDYLNKADVRYKEKLVVEIVYYLGIQLAPKYASSEDGASIVSEKYGRKVSELGYQISIEMPFVGGQFDKEIHVSTQGVADGDVRSISGVYGWTMRCRGNVKKAVVSVE